METNFNGHLSKARQVIERSFALLLGRFWRLKYLDMNRTSLIPYTIVAACVLHNLCLLDDDDSGKAGNFLKICSNTVFKEMQM